VQPQLLVQGLLHFLELVLAQNAVVHEDAGQPRLAFRVTQSTIDKHCCYRRIHTA
jgi:hypothetical protein